MTSHCTAISSGWQIDFPYAENIKPCLLSINFLQRLPVPLSSIVHVTYEQHGIPYFCSPLP